MLNFGALEEDYSSKLRIWNSVILWDAIPKIVSLGSCYPNATPDNPL